MPDTKPTLPGRLWKWIDLRTGLDQTLRHSLDEPIPGGARLAYVFGSALLFIFLSQIVTGLCLALYYVPAPMLAHVSVAYIVKEVAAGSFLRSLHSYGSSAMVVVLVLHFLQTFLYGSYKGNRELLWISGCTLAILVLGMAFTGYLLSWDQSAYSAGSVGTDLVGQVPFIGESLRLLLRGGAQMGALTLSRFYLLHLFVIPGLLFSFIAAHLVLFRKAGAAGPVNEDPIKPRLAAEMFYPKQVLIDMTFVFLVMGVLGTLAHFVPVPLGLEANPANTTYLPRPEWFYLPMFQWLKYWEGSRTVIGVFIIPLILGGLVFLLPFMDRGIERRPWRRPIPVGGVLVVLIGALWLGMTSRLADSRDPAVAAQLAQQKREAEVFSRAAFQPYSEASPSTRTASASAGGNVAEGKGLFDSHGCSECHGASGRGAKGPALTHIATQYKPAALVALLQAPTPKMRAAGMVPLTLGATEMTALASYLASLGGTSAAAVTASPPSGSAAPPSSAASAPPAAATASSSLGTAGAGKPPAGAMPGEKIYQSQGCAACHGVGGKGTPRGPALTGLGKKLSAKQVTHLLHHPNAKMKAGGMPAPKVSKPELASLVAYLEGLGSSGSQHAQGPATKADQPPAPPAGLPPAASPVTSTQAETDAGSGSSTPGASHQAGHDIFLKQGCAGCHGADGVGTSKAPPMAKLIGTITPAALTSVLHHPTHQMQSGGMPAVSLSSAEMASLVTYLQGLGAGAAGSQPSGRAPSSKGSPSTPMSALESKGQETFRAHHCADCHGVDGVGGSVAAPALAASGARQSPALLTKIMEHPTTRMQEGGMPPIALSDEELKELVAYVSHISGPKAPAR